MSDNDTRDDPHGLGALGLVGFYNDLWNRFDWGIGLWSQFDAHGEVADFTRGGTTVGPADPADWFAVSLSAGVTSFEVDFGSFSMLSSENQFRLEQGEVFESLNLTVTAYLNSAAVETWNIQYSLGMPNVSAEITAATDALIEIYSNGIGSLSEYEENRLGLMLDFQTRLLDGSLNTGAVFPSDDRDAALTQLEFLSGGYFSGYYQALRDVVYAWFDAELTVDGEEVLYNSDMNRVFAGAAGDRVYLEISGAQVSSTNDGTVTERAVEYGGISVDAYTLDWNEIEDALDAISGNDTAPDRATLESRAWSQNIGALEDIADDTGSVSFTIPSGGWTVVEAPTGDSGGTGGGGETGGGDLPGHSVFLNGTPQADLLVGGNYPDSILGFTGDDRIQGNGDSDILSGGFGADTINGGDGDDLIFGGPAQINDTEIIQLSSDGDLADIIYAGAGDDFADGGHGNDTIYGMDGNDTLLGYYGADMLQGQNGNDMLVGEALSDQLFGGAGDDFLNGGFGYDRLNGGAGADRFYHLGVADHGTDWVQDYTAADGDVLLFGGGAATGDDFLVQFAETANAGTAGVTEAFVTYVPTGQVLWALIDGGGQAEINLMAGGQVFDLLA